ncbi:MAG: hypothetical protein DMG20_09175 [Acidobacteria bacterium]|nr:MAG: hypothetical protein DMG20_09175 [Acidobacteriota bacterium]
MGEPAKIANPEGGRRPCTDSGLAGGPDAKKTRGGTGQNCKSGRRPKAVYRQWLGRAKRKPDRAQPELNARR